MMRKERLNSAPLNIWCEHLKDSTNKNITERLNELDNFDELTEEEEGEYYMLMEIETKSLETCSETVNLKKDMLKAFYSLKRKLKSDERLDVIFVERFNKEYLSGKVNSVDEVHKLFHRMMAEDLDVDGHETINEEFVLFKQKLEKQQDLKEESIQIWCDSPECPSEDCMYCSKSTDEENELALVRLEETGFFADNLTEKEKLVQLMVWINRLEDNFDEFIDGLIDDSEDDE